MKPIAFKGAPFFAGLPFPPVGAGDGVTSAGLELGGEGGEPAVDGEGGDDEVGATAGDGGGEDEEGDGGMVGDPEEGAMLLRSANTTTTIDLFLRQFFSMPLMK